MLHYDEISKKYQIRFIMDTDQDKKEMAYCNIHAMTISNAVKIVLGIPSVLFDETHITFQAWRESFYFSDRLTTHAISVYFMSSCSAEKIHFLKEILSRYHYYKLIIVLCMNSDVCIQFMNESIPVTYVVKSNLVSSELRQGILTAVAQLNQLAGASYSHVIAYQSDKAKGNDCTLECRIDKNNQTVRASLKQILENAQLGKTPFIQINKSTLINADYILSIEPAFNEVQMICSYNEEGETTFPISRKYRKQVKELYQRCQVKKN